MASSPNSHVVIFPFMAHGHDLPLIDISKALARQQVKVTIVTIPPNSKFISSKIQGFPLISIAELHFPATDGLSEASLCKNISEIPSMSFFASFLITTTHLKTPFQQLLQSMANSGDLPLCVISDYLLGWTLEICRQFAVPRLVFQGTGVAQMLITKAVMTKKSDYITSSSSISDFIRRLLPNLPFDVTAADVPDINLTSDTNTNPFIKFMAEAEEADGQSSGFIVNSFLELESDQIPPLESFYSNGAKGWCLGPTCLYGRETNASRESNADLMKWLDARAAASVIYVAFGTTAMVSDAQLEAVALGLEESGCPFVLVIRSNTWCAPEGIIGSKGLIVREFVDQLEVLFHSAIGGFLSHCGWNSVMESLTAGVPILAWPVMAEQKLNRKYLVEGMGIGIGIEKEENINDSFVSKEKISATVRDLMIGEKGKKAREKAGELGRLARRAVEDGGSSDATLKKMLQELHAFRSKNLADPKFLFRGLYLKFEASKVLSVNMIYELGLKYYIKNSNS